MENQSLRPTPLAFIQSTTLGCNIYADLQHVDRILYLISFDFKYRMFVNIFDGSYYAEMQHFSEVSVQIQVRDILSVFIKDNIFRNVHWTFCWNVACT